MLAVEGVGEELGEGFCGFEGGDSRESFRRIDVGRGGVRSECALQPGLFGKTPVSPDGEPPGVRQDSLAQHTSKLESFRKFEETWQVFVIEIKPGVQQGISEGHGILSRGLTRPLDVGSRR